MVAFPRPCDSYRALAVVKYECTYRHSRAYDVDSLNITQQERRNRNLLDVNSEHLIAVKAELDRMQTDCTAGEIIWQWSIMSVKLIILRHDRVWNYVRIREKGSKHGKVSII